MSAARALTAEDYAFSRLLSYIAYQWPGYRDAEHHRLICRKLEAVERGEIKRLIISVPPRHGKSLIASTYFPAWYLGRNPDKYIITATYGQDLADDFGRQVKNQIADEAFAGIFPGVALANDSRSSRRFAVDGQAGGIEQATNRQGAYYAVGVGGPLTGRGAHVLIVDDPVRNREDADSDTIRRKIKDWFTSTAFTRLMPGGAVIVIQTRWHEDGTLSIYPLWPKKTTRWAASRVRRCGLSNTTRKSWRTSAALLALAIGRRSISSAPHPTPATILNANG
jgi:hypothetical protein